MLGVWDNGHVTDRSGRVGSRSWLMTGEDKFGVMRVDFEKKARSKWKCLGGYRAWGLELNERIENDDMVVCYCQNFIDLPTVDEGSVSSNR